MGVYTFCRGFGHRKYDPAMPLPLRGSNLQGYAVTRSLRAVPWGFR